MSNTLVVACAQTGSVGEARSLNETLAIATTWVADAAGRGASIVLFPELFHAPFFPRELRTEFERLFLSTQAEEFAVLKDACREHGIAAIFPIAERAGPFLYNSAAFVDGAGELRGIYRKTHIPAYFPTDNPGGTGSYEKLYFAPGEILPLFEHTGQPFGIQICNDRLHPEASRVLALQGARIIFMPISYSTYDQSEQRRANWDAVLRTRAIENGVFVVACNRVGREGPRHHLGLSMIISPTGGVLATASDCEEELLVAALDLGDVDRARFGMPWWRDRRPALYGALTATEPPLQACPPAKGSRRTTRPCTGRRSPS